MKLIDLMNELQPHPMEGKAEIKIPLRIYDIHPREMEGNELWLDILATDFDDLKKYPADIQEDVMIAMMHKISEVLIELDNVDYVSVEGYNKSSGSYEVKVEIIEDSIVEAREYYHSLKYAELEARIDEDGDLIISVDGFEDALSRPCDAKVWEEWQEGHAAPLIDFLLLDLEDGTLTTPVFL